MHSSEFSITITPKSKSIAGQAKLNVAVKSEDCTLQSMSSKNIDEECVICCQKFTGIHGRHAPRRLPCRCRKSMCESCINMVLSTNDSCPFCRDVLLCRSSKELPICANVPRQLQTPSSVYIDSPYSSATERLTFMQQQLRDVQRARGSNSAILQQAMRYTEQQLNFLHQAEKSTPNGLIHGEIPRTWAGQTRWLPSRMSSDRVNNACLNSVESSRFNSRISRLSSLAGSQHSSAAGSRAASVAGSRANSIAGSRPASVAGSRPDALCESREECTVDSQSDTLPDRPASVNFNSSLVKLAAGISLPFTSGGMPRRPVRSNIRRLGSCRNSKHSSRHAWFDNTNGLIEPPISLSTLYEEVSSNKQPRHGAMTLSSGLHLGKSWNENQSSPFIINQMSLSIRSNANFNN